MDECAGLVMETMPLLMRIMRRANGRVAGLSMPQFRTLRILHRHPGLSLSALAEKLDLTLASASKLIDVLVKHDLVARVYSLSDRRRVELRLSAQGQAMLASMWQAAHTRLTDALGQLSDGDRALVIQAMRALQTALAVETAGAPDPAPRGHG
ncbi:MAG TPA: MarR family transcriptional regulator [Armatimonadota bacterium]|nr:MarR family transcriptional regulator [Armatimonadota bacterium]